MNRMGCLVVALLWWGGTGRGAEPAPAMSPEATTAELVRQLGAAGWQARDRAEAQLLKLGAQAVPLLSEHKDALDPEIRLRVRRVLDNLVAFSNRSFFERGGVCRGYADGGDAKWPCVFEVTQFDPATGVFSGTVEWTTLNALHAIEGKLEANRVQFRETKIIRQGNAVIDCVYALDLAPPRADAPGTIRGRWENPNDGRFGNVELNLDIPPAKPKPAE
jgi:hypothetical protein